LTNFDEIWHSDAYQPCGPPQLIKYEISEMQDGGGRHPENSKNHNNSNGLADFLRNLAR